MRLEETDILDLLTSLVDKSLVVYEEPPNGGGRYRLLETVRLYAGERLENAGDAVAVSDRHLDFFLAVAEAGWPEISNPSETAWHERIDVEQNNLYAALRWCDSAKNGVTKGLRLGTLLHKFWLVRGPLDLGRSALREALALVDGGEPTLPRAGALHAAGTLATAQGDYAQARALTGAALGIRLALGDERGAALSLSELGYLATIRGDFEEARAQLEEALAIGHRLDDGMVVDFAHLCLAHLALYRGDPCSCRSLLERLTAPPNTPVPPDQLGLRAWLAHAEGDVASARRLQERTLAVRRELGYKRAIGWSLCHLARIAVTEGNLPEACHHLCEGLSLLRDIGERDGVRWTLDCAGVLAAAGRDYRRAARLLAAVEALGEALNVVMMSHTRAEHDALVGQVREAVGAQAFESAWAEGRAMSFDETVESTLNWLRADSGDNSGNAA